ncbi:HNH endonuclease signature motif containing protein [Mycolicibacterium sp. XJ662]
MTASDEILSTLDVALYAFALVPPSKDESDTASTYRDLMLARTSREGLRRSADRDTVFAAHRLRVALQLAPIEAIAYSNANPVARWKIVRDHLTQKYPDTAGELLDILARRIAVTLSDWEVPRRSAGSHYRAVWMKSDGRCSACHFDFKTKSSRALSALDPFKPYYQSPEELTSEEIDHIVAISGVGTDVVDNLQLLCRWCNFGKSDGLGVDIRREAEFAAISVESIPRSHRAAMFYMTLAHYDFKCGSCNSRTELTIRLSDPRHGFLLSNLAAVCYECST